MLPAQWARRSTQRSPAHRIVAIFAQRTPNSVQQVRSAAVADCGASVVAAAVAAGRLCEQLRCSRPLRRRRRDRPRWPASTRSADAASCLRRAIAATSSRNHRSRRHQSRRRCLGRCRPFERLPDVGRALRRLSAALRLPL